MAENVNDPLVENRDTKKAQRIDATKEPKAGLDSSTVAVYVTVYDNIAGTPKVLEPLSLVRNSGSELKPMDGSEMNKYTWGVLFGEATVSVALNALGETIGKRAVPIIETFKSEFQFTKDPQQIKLLISMQEQQEDTMLLFSDAGVASIEVLSIVAKLR